MCNSDDEESAGKKMQKKNNMRGRAEVGGEHERRAAGVGLNILSARFPTAER